MERRGLVENERCVLVEFYEEGALAVGYRCWLNQVYTDKELDDIIEHQQEVEIIWPKCDIHTARRMKTVMKGLSEDDWETYNVKIFGFGGKFDGFLFCKFSHI